MNCGCRHLALTATAGHDTQVLLYVLSQHKWEDDGRLGLEYAGKAGMSRGKRMWMRMASGDILSVRLRASTELSRGPHAEGPSKEPPRAPFDKLSMPALAGKLALAA